MMMSGSLSFPILLLRVSAGTSHLGMSLEILDSLPLIIAFSLCSSLLQWPLFQSGVSPVIICMLSTCIVHTRTLQSIQTFCTYHCICFAPCHHVIRESE